MRLLQNEKIFNSLENQYTANSIEHEGVPMNKQQESVYTLAFADEPMRRVVSIGHTHVSFNIGGYKEFSSVEEINEFKHRWRNHFYDLNKLVIMSEPSKKRP